MFNGVTIIITIISVILVIIVWHIETRNETMNKTYCQHCNERIVHVKHGWATYTLLNKHQTFGNPNHCTQHTEGHEPR